jgi:hypothetical protein
VHPFSGKPLTWLEIWSFGRFNLALGEEEFWRLTLAQYDALAARYKEGQEWHDYRAALICSVNAEINRDRKKRARPFSPKDFMPGRRGGGKPQSARRGGRQNMNRHIRLALVILACCLLAGLAVYAGCREKSSAGRVTIESSVNSTLIYTSTTTIEGKTSRSYATGVFLNGGGYLRLVGLHQLDPGRSYRFTIIPHGEGWDEVIKIEELK